MPVSLVEIADREDGISTETTALAPTGAGIDLKAENRELRRRSKQKQENDTLRRATAYFARDVLPK